VLYRTALARAGEVGRLDENELNSQV